ncbi:MAG: hypothetical protein F4Y86_09275 [Gammaproteobacteria bacterium]|nr:hypothetical protein [Gammaproteobacteria bacterium]MYB38228.1 hypothetical protein [Gammaproteobacteria bacterium]
MGVAALAGVAVQSHWGIQPESLAGLLAPLAIYVGVGLLAGHLISKRYHMKYEIRRRPDPAARQVGRDGQCPARARRDD